MPLLGLVIPLKVLIPAWTLVGLVASITLFGRDRHHVAWGDIARLVPTCVIGILAGLYLFKTLDSAALAKGLGVLVLLYGLYSLWMSWRPRANWNVSPRVAAPIVGLFGGWAVGEYTRDVLIVAAIALPLMLAGIFIGNRVHTGLSELAFRRLVSGALIVSGLALLAKSG
jgi:uncharacterized membrane protein YfcA